MEISEQLDNIRGQQEARHVADSGLTGFEQTMIEEGLLSNRKISDQLDRETRGAEQLQEEPPVSELSFLGSKDFEVLKNAVDPSKRPKDRLGIDRAFGRRSTESSVATDDFTDESEVVSVTIYIFTGPLKVKLRVESRPVRSSAAPRKHAMSYLENLKVVHDKTRSYQFPYHLYRTAITTNRSIQTEPELG